MQAELPLVMSSLDTRGAFLCDDGLRILLWCGGELAPEIASQLQTNEKVGLKENTLTADSIGRRIIHTTHMNGML